MRCYTMFILVFTIMLSATAPGFAGEVQQPASATAAIREEIKSQLPVPPKGFEWQLYKNAVFLKPLPWHKKEKDGSSSGIPITVYASSPDEFSETKQFETGLTLQIISGSQKVLGIEASKMALIYLKPFLKAHKNEEVLLLEQNSHGAFERTFFRYRDAPPGLQPIIVHKFILANNSTDSVHVFTFESPADSWEENWATYGTPILSKLSILPNIAPN